MDRIHCRPAHTLGPRNLARGLAHSQTLKELTYFVHLEPPVSHRVPLGKSSKVTRSRSPRPQKTSLHWPHLAANRVALSGRNSTGPIWPQLKWLYVPANSQRVHSEELRMASAAPGIY